MERGEPDAAADSAPSVEEQVASRVAEQPLGASGSLVDAAEQRGTEGQTQEELVGAQQLQARVDAAKAKLRAALLDQQPGAVKAQARPLSASVSTLHYLSVSQKQ